MNILSTNTRPAVSAIQPSNEAFDGTEKTSVPRSEISRSEGCKSALDKSAGAKSSNDESVFDPDLYPSRTRVSIARAAVKACTHLGIEDERIRITLGLPSESVVALRNYESMVGIDDESLRRSLFVVDVFEFLEDAGFDPIRRRA